MRVEHEGPLCHMVEKQLSQMRHSVASSATRISQDNRFWGPDSGPELTGRHTLISFYSFPKIKEKGFHHGPHQVGVCSVVGIAALLITFLGHTL